MENNEPELGQEERIKLMSAALASPPVQQMLSKWEGEKTLLRKQAIEFWKAFDKEFEDFWNKISVDIRSAFIMTAIEDLVDGVIINFFHLSIISGLIINKIRVA
jgi:hypothetical protein